MASHTARAGDVWVRSSLATPGGRTWAQRQTVIDFEYNEEDKPRGSAFGRKGDQPSTAADTALVVGVASVERRSQRLHAAESSSASALRTQSPVSRNVAVAPTSGAYVISRKGP